MSKRDYNEFRETDHSIIRPTLLVLSGFSGTGKTTIRDKVMTRIPKAQFSLSVTTRPRRKHERGRIDYHFISSGSFQEMIRNNEMLEWEEVHTNYYGTLLQPVERALKKPGLFIFDVDVHGGLSIKSRFPDAILIFLNAPDFDILKQRLVDRHTDSPEQIKQRLNRIPKELDMSKQYDHIVINDDSDRAADEICGLIFDFQKQ